MAEKSSFAQNHSVMIFACILAVALAGYMLYRIDVQKKSFDAVVKTALQTSEGYDKAFIDMVNNLEDELAERASFGYAGRKDPMTGTVRTVVIPNKAHVARRGTGAGVRPQQKTAADETTAVKAAEAVDPVRLTAIIFDNTKKTFTAVVMDGERSYSVDVGDRVAGRRILRITNQEIMMESDTERFMYNISGDSRRAHK
ncbi:MAG: hypothetical protein LBB56_06820 [Chitinispirillales bacterium]|jgi:hypothetical protein|nr:hypothetical protein [Chitinispirillales bacterium]